MRYESAGELAAKADYEGGIEAMLYGYGLSLEELPDDTPDSIRDDIEQALALAATLDRIREWLDEALQQYVEEDF